MVKKLVGHVQCPECDFADADVGEDKKGHLYRYCPECNAQFFTHGHAKRAANLKKRMRPLAAPTPAADPAPAKKPRNALEEFMERNK